MGLEHLGDSAIPVNLKKAVLSCRNDGWSNTLEAWIISLFSLAYADFKGNQNAIISLLWKCLGCLFSFLSRRRIFILTNWISQSQNPFSRLSRILFTNALSALTK